MIREHKLTHEADSMPKAALEKPMTQVGQNGGSGRTQTTIESRIDASRQNRIEDSNAAGRRYRFERLSLTMVLRDFWFSKSDPGPGERVPEFDLPT